MLYTKTVGCKHVYYCSKVGHFNIPVNCCSFCSQPQADTHGTAPFCTSAQASLISLGGHLLCTHKWKWPSSWFLNEISYFSEFFINQILKMWTWWPEHAITFSTCKCSSRFIIQWSLQELHEMALPNLTGCVWTCWMYTRLRLVQIKQLKRLCHSIDVFLRLHIWMVCHWFHRCSLTHPLQPWSPAEDNDHYILHVIIHVQFS